MGGYCGTRSLRHTEGQGSGGRRRAEESSNIARRKGAGKGELKYTPTKKDNATPEVKGCDT